MSLNILLEGETMIRKILVAGIGVATALALASCGSSSPAPGAAGLQNVSASPDISESPSAAPNPTVTVTATPTATNAPAGAKPCSSADLKVAASGEDDGAAGTIVQRFLITNTSAVPCTMKGHPAITPFGLMKQGNSQAEANIDIKVGPIPSNFGDLGAQSRRPAPRCSS
jgi:hypothetical protein